MGRTFKKNYPSEASTLLNLTKISSSSEEMSYITKMRNLILFQISSPEEFQYLDGRFYHQFWIHNRCFPIFRMCYSHAFFQVAKSHVLVHNHEPFRHWDTIIIDNDGQPKTKNGHEMKAINGSNINTMPIKKFLIANNGLASTSFPRWNFYPYYKGIITSIQSNVFEQFYTTDSSILRHESIWRRVYDANLTFFFCEYNDFSLYVLEQKRHKTPINVFKTILERQNGICFNEKSVLKTIASPYYYILPYQDERKYAEFARNASVSLIHVLNISIFQFICQTDIALKSVS
ncbi:uncharacterized protein TNIN_217821 [Trichonephila inaurata madagascariensis]|uniref:Uncharacterized protein n=1 Tax=Trichonephila inaurata madagascariensis TaxID=2747483 RepID=A0A8X6YYZ3_9ARAC|nr:uncharacterized protein TNIN_217821 [Trichonephila inaurata madagascariensis]